MIFQLKNKHISLHCQHELLFNKQFIMKKFILLLVLVMTTASISGCNSDKKDTPVTETENTTCSVSIQAYLDDADMKGRGDKEVKAGDNIVVDYVGRLDESTVFDTSVESVAKACEKHTPGRDYTSGLPFEVGAGQMIAGFDKGVVGMKIGQTKTLTIPAAEAYGERAKEKLITVDKSQVPEADKYEK